MKFLKCKDSNRGSTGEFFHSAQPGTHRTDLKLAYDCVLVIDWLPQRMIIHRDGSTVERDAHDRH